MTIDKVSPLIDELTLNTYEEKVEEIVSEQDFMRSILDFQSNVIVVLEKDKAVSCNKNFLDIAGVLSLEDFYKERSFFHDLFIPDDNCIWGSIDYKWLDKIHETNRHNLQSHIKIFDHTKGEERLFHPELRELKGYKNIHILSLNDVTESVRYSNLLAEQNRELEKKVRERTNLLKKAYENLEEKNELIEAIMQVTPLGIITIDNNGEVLYANEKAQELLNLKRLDNSEKKYEMPSWELTDLEGNPVTEDSRPYMVIKKTKKALKGQRQTIIKDKKKIELSINGAPLLDENGNFEAAVFILEDITNRLKLEEENRLKERLLVQQSKMATMGEMISSIAHQWKQPLNNLGLLIQGLSFDREFGEITKKAIDSFTDESMAQIEYMSETVNDFRNLFKPDKIKRSFNPRESIEEVITILHSQFHCANITVSVKDSRGSSFEINGYPNEFKQAVINVLCNSRDAIKDCQRKSGLEQGEIIISMEDEREHLLISFQDNGGGAPKDILGKIFEPYETSKGEEGTGIGLYMVRLIVEESMKGKVEFKNINDGAEITFLLDSKNL